MQYLRLLIFVFKGHFFHPTMPNLFYPGFAKNSVRNLVFMILIENNVLKQEKLHSLNYVNFYVCSDVH